jgi:DNA-binding GntR family transcriptional regulator
MEHLSLKESAYKIIKEKLLNLEFEPGSRLREDLLAQEISMSRTPVREAVSQLSAEGFLHNVPRKGIFVMQLTSQEISDFLDIREALETLAVEDCIRKIDAGQLAVLRGILAEFAAALARGDYKKCNLLDSRFHLEIAKVSNNKKLIEFLGEIEDFMHIARAIEKKARPQEKNELTLQEHQAVFAAIQSKDVQKARESIKANIKTMKENLGIR